jgi:hypothetical protein
MWYNDAEDYVSWIIVVSSLFFWVLKVNEAKPRWRAALLLIIGFAGGLYVGIEMTAKDYFNLPLWVMQRQLHEVWNLPMKQLQRPVDKESP